MSVPESIPGVRVLLEGETGSGKTHSIRTLHNLEGIDDIFVIFTEPGMEVLADLTHDHYHWTYVKPVASKMESLIDKARTMNSMSWDGMQKALQNDPNKKDYDAGVRLLEAMHKPVCAECGKEFPDVSEWTNRQVLVLDSLSGLNTAAMQLIIGGSLVRSQPQWGAAQDTEMMLINKLCYDTNAHFVLTAHVEKMLDEINGGQVVKVNALGKALAPEIPKNFSDVIYCYRVSDQFKWSTASTGVETKARNVPISDKIEPSFKQIIQKWRSRYDVKQEAQKQEATTQQ